MSSSPVNRTRSALEDLGSALSDFASGLSDHAHDLKHEGKAQSEQLWTGVRNGAEVAGDHLGRYWGQVRRRPRTTVGVVLGAVALGVAAGMLFKHRGE